MFTVLILRQYFTWLTAITVLWESAAKRSQSPEPSNRAEQAHGNISRAGEAMDAYDRILPHLLTERAFGLK